MSLNTVTLDVRDDIRNGREPFSKVMRAVSELKSDEQLLLIAPFEPAPLFKVLERQGFSHQSNAGQAGDWEVIFTRSRAGCAPDSPTAASPPEAVRSSQGLEVDARGLEPPEPMVRILEAAATLPLGAELLARTDRRPMHLYDQLEARGFKAQTEESTDGSFITHIRRR